MTKETHITSLQHPIVKHLVKLRENRSYRYASHRVVIASGKVLMELANTVPFITVLAKEGEALPHWLKGDRLCWVPPEVLKKVSGTASPEPFIVEVAMPTPSRLDGMDYLVAFDGVADPGNLGTLLRTALALGWQGAFILPSSCDPYNDKALAAARGATFRLPWATGTWQDLSLLASRQGIPCLVADIKGKSVDEVALHKGQVLVLGNEAHGPDRKVKELHTSITLPMAGSMESLNVAVAGGILLYLLQPKRKESACSDEHE